jgi:hypothetical protein
MASTRYADNYYTAVPQHSQVGVKVVREFILTLAAAIVINDLFKFGQIPALVMLDDFWVDVPDVDAATAFVCALGDNTTAAKYVTGSVIGQAAGYIYRGGTGFVAASLPAKYSAANDLVLKCTTAPTTSATTGAFQGWYAYHAYGATPF